jgi:hypothetical protein
MVRETNAVCQNGVFEWVMVRHLIAHVRANKGIEPGSRTPANSRRRRRGPTSSPIACIGGAGTPRRASCPSYPGGYA